MAVPAVPLLDVHLQDLVALGTLPTYTEGSSSLLNYRKFMLVGQTLCALARLQQTPMGLHTSAQVQLVVRAASVCTVSSDDIVGTALARGCLRAAPTGPMSTTKALLGLLKLLGKPA